MSEKNDLQGIRTLFRQYAPALALYARQWCRYPEDAVQEAMFDLLRASVAPRDPVAWLFHAVRCRAMNIARSEMRRARHQRNAAREKEEWFKSSPDAGIPAAEIQLLIGQLPQLEQEIVIARIWGELSFEQIAQLVDRSISAVHRRYLSALGQLGKSLEANLERLKTP